VTPVDQLEEQVRVAVGVREIADLIDDQQIGCRIATQPVAQRRVTVQAGQITEQLPSGGKQHRVSFQDCLMRNVLSDHRLAQAAAADQENVGRRRQEVQRHQFGDRPLMHRGHPDDSASMRRG